MAAIFKRMLWCCVMEGSRFAWNIEFLEGAPIALMSGRGLGQRIAPGTASFRTSCVSARTLCSLHDGVGGRAHDKVSPFGAAHTHCPLRTFKSDTAHAGTDGSQIKPKAVDHMGWFGAVKNTTVCHAHLSWLKLCMTILKPLPSLPMRADTGT